MEKKNKIFFVTASTSGGGAERMLFNIINSLNDSFDKKIIITSNDIPPKGLFTCPIFYLKKKHAICSFLQMYNILKKEKPDYLFTTSSNIGYLLIFIKILLLCRTKVIIRCAVTPSEIYVSSKKDFILKYIIKYTYNLSDLVIAQTDYMKKDLINTYKIKSNKVKTIRNIIDKHNLNYLSNLYKPCEFDNSNYNIIAAGALYSVKGFDILINAIAPILKNKNHIQLYILGNERYEKGYKNYLQRLIDENGVHSKIHLLGYRENPYPYYKEADLFIMSSRKEGFPNVVLEALYLGTPVIASDCVDFTNIIFQSVNGYVVEKNNVDSLRRGIELALNTDFDVYKNPIKNFDYNLLFV